MRILIAPDKFKGTLTATEAAAAMRRGVERAARELSIEIEVDECPVADGGEGTLEAIGSVTEEPIMRVRIHPQVGRSFRARVQIIDPSGAFRDRYPMVIILTMLLGIMGLCAITFVVTHTLFRMTTLAITFICAMLSAIIGVLVLLSLIHTRRTTPPDARRRALIEVAEVLGSKVFSPASRNPEVIGSQPVAALVQAALAEGCGQVLIGLGGTSSVDGGIGLGDLACEFLDGKGEPLLGAGSSLARIGRILWRPLDSRVAHANFIALCDVQSPLLGPRGAARMFGPQKGATPEQVERLEKGLENLVRVCRECNIPCDPDAPGAGAAGGLGFGLATFLGAKLVPGAPYILDLLNFDERCKRADLVITGEGKMDMQTAEGKACAEVAKRAERAGKPCIAVVGTTDEAPEALKHALAESGVRLDAIHRLTDQQPDAQSTAGSAADRIVAATYQAVFDRMHTG